MSNEYTVTTDNGEYEYDHGTVEVVKKEDGEWAVEGDFHLVLSSDNYIDLCREIQGVVRKYAL